MVKNYLGIDVGGTEIKWVTMNPVQLKLPTGRKKATPRDRQSFLVALSDLVNATLGRSAGLAKREEAVSGIGVGLPCIIDPRKKIIAKCNNMPFLDSWNVGAFFYQFGLPFAIENDSRCFVRAEAAIGAARGYQTIVGLTIGTGIGGGIIIEGKMYAGAGYAAGEFGGMVMAGSHSLESLGAKAAFEKFGDRSEIIGGGVANIINAFDPEIVVLGGGGVTSGGVRLSVVRRIASDFVVAPHGKKTPIVKGVLGEYAQAMGAALLLETGREKKGRA